MEVSESPDFDPTLLAKEVSETNFSISGLADTTAYYWRVRANVEGQLSAWSSVWTFTTGFNENPIADAPELLFPENGIDKQALAVYLIWDDIEDLNNYRLEVSTNEDFSGLVIDELLEKKAHFFLEDLDYHTTYYWRVRGENNLGEGAWSQVRSFTTVRQMDEGPQLTGPVNNKDNIGFPAELTWNAYTDTYFYELEVSSSPDFDPTLLAKEVIETNFSVSGLSDTTAYYWRVRANVEGQLSAWSSAWTFTTGFNENPIADAPELLFPENEVDKQARSVYLIWNDVENLNNYRLEVSNKEDFSDLVLDELLEKKAHFFLEDLDYHTTYYWRVRGENNLGAGNWSETRSFTTVRQMDEGPQLSGPVNNKENIGFPANLSWNPYTDADYYELEVSSNPDFDPTLFAKEVSETSFSASGLADTTAYYWRVRANVEGQLSAWSQAWTFTSGFNENPIVEVPELLFPENGIDKQALAVYLIWDDIKDLNNYRLEVSTKEDFSSLVKDELLEKKAHYYIEDLDFYTTYYWRVRGENNLGFGDWSEPRSFTTVRQMDEGPQLSGPANNKDNIGFPANLSWSSYTDADFYELEVSSSPDFDPTLLAKEVSETTFSVSGLADTTAYYWRVRANVEGQLSAWSSVWTFTSGFNENLIAAAPELLFPENEVDKQARAVYLIWSAVEDINAYELQISTHDNFSDLFVNTTISDETFYHAESLDYYTTYYWRVRGTNNKGSGSWSDVYSFTTLRNTEEGPVLSSPTSGSENVSYPINLSWETFAETDFYELQLAESPSFDTTMSANKLTNTQFIVPIFADTTTYYWRVRASVDEQLTAWSEAWTFTTALELPEIPTWSPNNGEENVSTSPNLVWAPSERAESYQLQVSKAENFENTVMDVGNIEQTEYQIEELDGETTYYWRVQAVNAVGVSGWSDVRTFRTERPTSNELVKELPNEFVLQQNYPNPFNPTTNITYGIPEASDVRLEVFNMLGQKVATLINSKQSAGWHTISFDARGLSSGFYVYRIQAGEFVATKKLMLMK